MPLFNIGNLIKHRREELGITQEELSEGICSVPTLSRIENGVHPPTRNHAQALLQRLGYSNAVSFCVSDKEEFEITELQMKSRLAYMRNDFDTARELLSELIKYKEFFSATDRQYYEIMYTVLHKNDLSESEALMRFENALSITHPLYGRNSLPKILTFEEITALNNIAIRLYNIDETTDAINILYYLKDYCEKSIIDTQESIRTLPMIIYNLSKYLSLEGRYSECIAVCDEGIRLAKDTGRCRALAQTMYNRACALIKRGQPCDAELAKESAKKAYILSELIGGGPRTTERIAEFILDNFGENPPSI